jgi:hypothetical protein
MESPTRDKAAYLQQLALTQREAMQTLADLDSAAVVYAESGWTVKDIVAHLAAWDEETALCFKAYGDGGSYSIPGYVWGHYDEFNWAAYEQRKDLPTAEVYASWDSARSRIYAAVERLTPEQIAGEMTYPSGQYANCDKLITEVIEHQELHFNDIFKALKR